MQKYNLQKIPKRNQNPSRYYNSIANLKFQHKPNFHLSKSPYIKIDLLPRGQNPSISLPRQARPTKRMLIRKWISALTALLLWTSPIREENIIKCGSSSTSYSSYVSYHGRCNKSCAAEESRWKLLRNSRSSTRGRRWCRTWPGHCMNSFFQLSSLGTVVWSSRIGWEGRMVSGGGLWIKLETRR